MAYTQKSSLSSDQVAFEQTAYFALRSMPLHEQIADVRAQTSPIGVLVYHSIFTQILHKQLLH